VAHSARCGGENQVDLPAEQVDHGRPAAFVRHVRDLGPRRHVEKLEREMTGTAHA
jgi:hypothetical protein